MNHLHDAERSFVTKIVDETRSLVRSEKPVHEKIARLQFAAAEQAKRISRLRSTVKENPEPSLKRNRVERLIEARERAMAYFRATAKYLTIRSRPPKSLVQMPRFFAAPTWERRMEVSHPTPPSEYPFMEYSS
ncbi:MAG TPA: hypothetical protein PKA27_10820 [Fimbriimonadaceae bacterium]|nr:hypothetical protein [Fimbriimonadaceae bacterium]